MYWNRIVHIVVSPVNIVIIHFFKRNININVILYNSYNSNMVLISHFPIELSIRLGNGELSVQCCAKKTKNLSLNCATKAPEGFHSIYRDVPGASFITNRFLTEPCEQPDGSRAKIIEFCIGKSLCNLVKS